MESSQRVLNKVNNMEENYLILVDLGSGLRVSLRSIEPHACQLKGEVYPTLQPISRASSPLRARIKLVVRQAHF